MMMMLLSIATVAALLCATSFERQAQSDSGAGSVFKLSVTQVWVENSPHTIFTGCKH